MTPDPVPTADQIETVAEITMLPTATVTLMISAYEQEVADAKWARTLEDIERWSAIRDETGDIKRVGDIEFFEGTGVVTRLGFRNLIRLRYGQPVLLSESGRVMSETYGAAVTVTADW